MIHYNDKFLRYLELQIRTFCDMQDYYYDAQCKCMLELRQDILNEQALASQKELLPDIIAFNDALYLALQKMFDHAHELYTRVSAIQKDIELEAKCFLQENYPSLHPFQNYCRQELWEALCDTGLNPLYDSGVTHSLVLPRDLDVSFDSFIGLDCNPLNWNERFNQRLTGNLHLINAFHNLFDHTNFALTDFIFVREFVEDINIRIGIKHSY